MAGQGYQSIGASEDVHSALDAEAPTPNVDQGILYHIVPDPYKRRWNHVEDLDSFFSRVYYYHQKHGFLCIFLSEIFGLVQFIFVVLLGTFLSECVDYNVLFDENKRTGNQTVSSKISLDDAVIPLQECVSGFGGIMWIVLLVASCFWILRVILVFYNTFQNWDIRAFYYYALRISDDDLDNLTWHDVQKRLRDVQREQQMCIHKQDLTELDIHHRILRFKNYMVAMINKELLPVRYNIPFVGEASFLTHGLKYNLELLLFWGPWAPFESSWHLRSDYKKLSKREELGNALSNRILWIGIANIMLSPLIFLWQILYSFFNYAEIVKREPGTLGMRRWSLYGKLYLRHFNELEHEINARLTRAYRSASKYMGIFSSPIMTIIAQNVAFVAGALFAVLSFLTIWDEDVLSVRHVLLDITVLGAIVAVCRACIPDEQLVFCPERLLSEICAHVHYLPDNWKGHAHTSMIRNKMALLFQYKAVYLLEELLSPFVTPLILIFYLRPRSFEIVDFYRNFTVEVIGVGDVCSFAQMNVRKHGNADWNACGGTDSSNDDENFDTDAKKQFMQAENGKTELSLMHFTHTNPDWLPPEDAADYISAVKDRALKDATLLPTLFEENALYSSLDNSLMGNGFGAAIFSGFMQRRDPSVIDPCTSTSESRGMIKGNNAFEVGPTSMTSRLQSSFRGGISRHEGPCGIPLHGFVSGAAGFGRSNFCGTGNSNMASFANSFAHTRLPGFSNQNSIRPYDASAIEFNALDMSLDALYLHELHTLELRRKCKTYASPSKSQQSSEGMGFGTEKLTETSNHQLKLQVPESRLSHTSESESTPLLTKHV